MKYFSHLSIFWMTGKVEEWTISGLSWLQDLATDEEEWNRTMGTTPDFYEIPPEQESGLLCAYSYFHRLYVIEWYYDYIGYDYYHEDFNFYYYDDNYYYYYEDYSGSGSGSGDYYQGSGNYYQGSGDYNQGSGDYYKGSGDFYQGSGDYYMGSGSGTKLIKLKHIFCDHV